MGFGFVHTADWQVGKPFGMFGDDKLAGRLEDARLEIVDRLAKVAQAHSVRHVLVAGDVYDSHRPSRKVLRQPLERMKRHEDIVWVLLPGNHDPIEESGVWERALQEDLPQNIIVLLKPEPVFLEDDVCVLPSPFGNCAIGVDPTQWMNTSKTPAGVIRVGLAHGSVKGFGSDADTSVLIDPRRAKAAKLDYLALGDWHGALKINSRTWYSGTPEADRFVGNDPGFALVVKIDKAGGEPHVEQVATGKYNWAEIEAVLEESADTVHVGRQIAKLSDDPARILLRMKLSGDVAPLQMKAIEEWRAQLEAQLQYLGVDDRQLQIVGDVDEIPEIHGSSELYSAFRKLQSLCDQENEVQANAAREALRRLMRYASAVGRGEI